MLTRPTAAMLMLVATLPIAARADAVADFYRGRTVNLVVGYGPGGGYDLCARLVARHLGEHIPGHPNVVVQNMSGGSGIAAMNYFVRRTEPNGLTVFMGSISTIDPLVFRNANAQYDPKTFRFVGGLGRGGSVIFLNKAAAARLYDKSAKPVMIGSVQAMPRPGTQPILWSIEYLGWNGAWVSGDGSDPSKVATVADIALYAHGTGALPPGVEGGLDAQTVYSD